jgi:hypothetical protein
MAALGVAGLADAVVASFTHAFTVAADVVTAVPLVAAVVIMARWFGTRPSAETEKATDGPRRRDSDRAPLGRWWVAWMAPIAAVTAWEIYCFVHLPREQHPTLSALIDILDSSRVGKLVGFLCWLALGWFLVAR